MRRAIAYDGNVSRFYDNKPEPAAAGIWRHVRELVPDDAACSWLSTRAQTTRAAIDEFWGYETHGPFYIVVDKTWRVLGDGRTLRAAIDSTHEYEQHADPCPHCGRYREAEDGWHAYPITPAAWSMLTCGGRYEDALQGDPWEFTWAAEWGALVWIPFVDCIVCHGEQALPVPSTGAALHLRPTVPCPCCRVEYEGSLEPEGMDWIEPPEAACVWSSP